MGLHSGALRKKSARGVILCIETKQIKVKSIYYVYLMTDSDKINILHVTKTTRIDSTIGVESQSLSTSIESFYNKRNTQPGTKTQDSD